MSGDSMAEAVDTETLLEAVDFEQLLEESDLKELLERDDVSAAAGEIGSAVGREFGAAAGGELGGVIAKAINERMSASELAENVKVALGDAFRQTMTSHAVRESIANELQSVIERKVSGELIGHETPDEDDETVDDDGEEDSDTGVKGSEDDEEGAGEEADEDGDGREADEDEEASDADVTEETEAEAEEKAESETVEERPESRADLDDLSYRELQSLAKEHDVKANLKHEQMADRLAKRLDLEE